MNKTNIAHLPLTQGFCELLCAEILLFLIQDIEKIVLIMRGSRVGGGGPH